MAALQDELAGIRQSNPSAEPGSAQIEQELKHWQAKRGRRNGPWQRVQLARHPKRPHSLDYIQRLITDFQEIHGDRAYADDPAIVCGHGLVRGISRSW